MSSIAQRTRRVKTYVELSFAALRGRVERPYFVWLLARGLDPSGSGRISLKAVRDFVADRRIATRQTLLRWLGQGDGIFWTRSRTHLRLKGLLTVALTLDVDLRRHPVYLPIEGFRSLGRFRRALVGSFFGDKKRPMSHSTLGELIGRTPRSVGRYLRGVPKTPKVMVSDRRPPPFSEPVHPDLAQQGYFRTKVDGQWVLAKRLPNSYYAPAETAPFGMVKRSYASSSLPEGLRRCFYRNPKAAARAVEGLLEGERIFVLQEGKRDFWGCEVWTGWSRTLGMVGVC